MIRDGKAETFMRELPHVYQEENLLHSILLSRMKDFDSLEQGLSCFLPWVDNWAVCDSLRPMLFYKKRNELIMRIPMWLADAHPYTIRFGLEMLMLHYLEDYFRPEYLEWAAAVTCEDYYVKMMVAWFFATALASRYSLAVGYLEKHRLSMWIHNKTIQKALESYRIPAQYKDCLRALKWCN